MRSALLTLCLWAAAPSMARAANPPAAAPAVPPAKEHKIRELLGLTGADQVGQKMLQQLQTQLPPEQYFQATQVIHPSDLVTLLVPIYNKHFSDEEIDGLLAFYRGPLGKKLASEMPSIAAESAQVGQVYARAKAMEIQSGHPDVPPAVKR